jgi:hypothetical protein
MLAMKPITMSFLACSTDSTDMPWTSSDSSGGGASALGAGIGTGNAGCNTGGGNSGGGGSCGCGGGGSGAPGSGGPPRGGSGGERGILSSGGGLFATSVGVVTDRYCLAGSTGNLPAANSDTCYSPGSGHSGTNICIGPNFPIRF